MLWTETFISSFNDSLDNSPELERKIKVLSSSSSSSSINNVTPTRQSKDDSSASPYQDVLPSKHRTSYRDVLVQNRLYSKDIFTRAVPQDQAPFLRTSILLFQKVNLLVRLTTQFFTLQMTLFDLQETHPMFVNMM
ncbi:hypothetical protein PoB_005379500 [Plakobranchus ocellatus]|uniref:Uncharacterized protein n=1 Tax=Plakobranchus ocellatus TaxID=259542 RepID=A0AAV4C6G6_9GAST|nr:hypothetical protein PoB_005379500 [Plakobranchus ocellatus]